MRQPLFLTATLVAVFHVSAIGSAVGQELVPRIINGQPTSGFESVGIVGTSVFGGFCSGTLISPMHVLTAAHCAELASGPGDGTFELDGVLFTTSAIYIHPDYDSNTLDNDLAIYELSSAVQFAVPSPLFRQTPQIGEPLTIVGYGAGGDAMAGEDGTFGVKMAGLTVIDDLTDSLLIWFFDDASESNSAPGDSGGPGFILVDGEYHIASVTSAGTRFDAGLGDVASNTRVDAFADWIDAILLNIPPVMDEMPDPNEPGPEQPDGELPDTDDPDGEEGENDSPSSPEKCPAGDHGVGDHGVGDHGVGDHGVADHGAGDSYSEVHPGSGNRPAGSHRPGSHRPGSYRPGSYRPQSYRPGNLHASGRRPGSPPHGGIRWGSDKAVDRRPGAAHPGIVKSHNQRSAASSAGRRATPASGGTPNLQFRPRGIFQADAIRQRSTSQQTTPRRQP